MDISKLQPGDNHFKAYVGPPGQYDFMGATQFCLLTSLGLRATHSLLDLGCGSLRAGRFLINYLDKGNYFGIEPNRWLIEDAISNLVGSDLIRLKKPQFDYNNEFKTDVFEEKFDFMVAHSIFSHTGSDLIKSALQNIRASLKDTGVAAVTFVEGLADFQGNGWVYPETVTFCPRTIKRMVNRTGLYARRIPWYHPRQTWYILAKEKKQLPRRALLRYLSGAVLNDPEFTDSWNWGRKMVVCINMFLRRTLPGPIKDFFKQFFAE